MKLETIYNRIIENIKENDIIKWQDLLEDINKQIRLETCYKTTSKTRINAIKRVADQTNMRPALSGYGIVEDYKVVTDIYHLIMIHEENMPLKLVTTDKELADKVGHENCINANYPNVLHFKDFNKDLYDVIELDLDEIATFYKLHKKNHKDEPIEINGFNYDITYLKNLIDVLGEDIKVYVSNDKELRPLYIENNKDELGLVLPIRTF